MRRVGRDLLEGGEGKMTSVSDSSIDRDEHAVHYIKTPQFSEHFVTGAYGGIDTSTGRMYMAMFAERGTIPQVIHFEVGADGKVIGERKEGRDGSVRSVSSVLHFEINTAISLRDWLDEKIEAFFKAHPEIKRPEKK